MRHFIWDFTVCKKDPFRGFPYTKGSFIVPSTLYVAVISEVRKCTYLKRAQLNSRILPICKQLNNTLNIYFGLWG